MTFNWLQYLGLAQQLAGKAQIYATQESRLRSAISRSYYAAFILARNYLRDEESISIPKQQTHKFVIQQFENSSEEVRQKIGKNLTRLRLSRNKADYDDNFDRLPEETKLMLKLANKTISAIENL
ncbi:MAG: HEPN domain-containing protein [Okeania sp. SIO2H7]|nr:HEPN domain-containing protein [Okeania sp. SIO2H7]